MVHSIPCVSQVVNILVIAYLPDFLQRTELWAFGVLSCNQAYVEDIKRLTGADAWLDSVELRKISGLECLSSILTEPKMENIYYISSWRVQKWLQTTF